MILQRYVLKREAEQAERMSVHSAMLGGANSTFGRNSTLPPRNGSVMSGSMRGSNFQRGGSLRGSDRSVKSHRRDIDDMALSMHHMGGSQHHLATGNGSSMAGYGRKDLDDMVRPSRQHFFRRNNSLQLEVEQPHGIMIIDGDGLLNGRHRSQVISV